MKTSIKNQLLVVLILLGVTGPAMAELGDYGFWRTLGNLVNPPAADNPVTAAQRQGDYPLLASRGSTMVFRQATITPGKPFPWHPKPALSVVTALSTSSL